MRALLLILILLGASASGLLLPPACRADEAADRLTLAVDALTRLEGIDLESNAAMKERVLVVLAKTRGTANFVRMVRHFSLTNQEEGLVEVAATLPRDENGVAAIKMVLTTGHANSIAATLARGDVRARGLAEALGHSGHRDSVKLLAPILSQTLTNGGDRGTNDGSQLREQVVRSLALSSDGAKALLELIRVGTVQGALRKLALDELAQVRWDVIKSEANALRGQATAKWPTVTELAQMAGNPAIGKVVYFRENPGCFNCHVVNGQGTDFGPNLSEIGSKLAKEALFQAILEPNVGISFGYEAYTLILKDGEEAYGLIASETASEVAIKSIGAVVTRFNKDAIGSRQKSPLSIMPAGLEAGLAPQELVDLVAFLASLKKAD